MALCPLNDDEVRRPAAFRARIDCNTMFVRRGVPYEIGAVRYGRAVRTCVISSALWWYIRPPRMVEGALGQVVHASAASTKAARLAMQRIEESVRTVARGAGFSWRRRRNPGGGAHMLDQQVRVAA